MKSTGEVMGIDSSFGMAFFKSQMAAGSALPAGGNVFISVRDRDKHGVVPLARQLSELGFDLYATQGTSNVLWKAGIKSKALFRISDGHPNVIDLVEDKQVGWIVNTPSSGARPRMDEVKMRAHAVIRGVPITTTLDGLRAAIDGLQVWRKTQPLEVCSLQEFHRHSPRLSFETVGSAPRGRAEGQEE